MIEKLLKSLLEKHTWNVWEIEHKKEMFWHVCKNEFTEVFHLIKHSIPHEDFIELIMYEDGHGDNGSMLAAKYASTSVLMSLLSIIFGSDSPSLMDKYLHHENKSRETLLKLVLSHESTMSIQRDILIKFERDYHRKTGTYSLVECFKNKIGAHYIIEKAMQEERSFEGNTTCPKVMPWIMSGLAIIVPFLLYISEIIFGALLAQQYYDDVINDDTGIVPENCGITKNETEFINEYECKYGLNYTQIKDLYCIPKGEPGEEYAMSPKNMLMYTVGFMILPIIGYMGEWFFHFNPIEKVN